VHAVKGARDEEVREGEAVEHCGSRPTGEIGTLHRGS
jgi:hypothetical protein